ncbi:hypothetical protein RKD32_006851 [Streptomyces sp. SAI-195]
MKGGPHDSTAAGGRTGLPGRVAAVSQSGAAESVRMPMTAEPNGTRQASRPDQREAPARATAARGLRRGEAPATCRQLMGGHDAEAPRRRDTGAPVHWGTGAPLRLAGASRGHSGTGDSRGLRAPGGCWGCSALGTAGLRAYRGCFCLGTPWPPAPALRAHSSPRASGGPSGRLDARDLRHHSGSQRLLGLPGYGDCRGCALTQAACVSGRPGRGLAGALAPGPPGEPPGTVPGARLSRAGRVGPSGPG